MLVKPGHLSLKPYHRNAPRPISPPERAEGAAVPELTHCPTCGQFCGSLWAVAAHVLNEECEA